MRDTVPLPLASPVGPLTLMISASAIHRLDFGPCPRRPVPEEIRPLFERAKAQLAEFFAGERENFDLPLEPGPPGTPFQEAVWRALREIPYGQVISYGDLAAWAGHPGASRAAGSACGANRIAVIIPCHRALAKSGLGGLGGGLEAKRILLNIERKTR